mgnify:FL=1
MAHKYAEQMFTENVKVIQEIAGSRKSYARMEQGDAYNSILGPNEMEFINESDSFYMASVSETGWPYVQHRGGNKGFVSIIDEATIGFSDFSGNKQYISVGNFKSNNKVSLFFMDYKNKRRLKLIGHVQVINDEAILNKLAPIDYSARIERGIIITIEGYDWNCPQHITKRYTDDDIRPLLDRITELESQLATS